MEKKKRQVFLYLEKYMSIHYNFLWGHFQLGKKNKKYTGIKTMSTH